MEDTAAAKAETQDINMARWWAGSAVIVDGPARPVTIEREAWKTYDSERERNDKNAPPRQGPPVRLQAAAADRFRCTARLYCDSQASGERKTDEA